MKSLIIAMLSIFALSCTFLTPKENTSLEEQARAVRSLSHTATFFGLLEINDDDVVKASEDAERISSVIRSDILPVLRNEGSVKGTILRESLKLFDTKYVALLGSAIDLLTVYYEVPNPQDVITEDQRTLLIAFFEGVLAGTNDVLLLVEEE